MATFRKRKNKAGDWSVTASVRRKGVIGSVAETFRGELRGAMASAKQWAAQVEAQIYYKRFQDPRSGDVPLGGVIDRYFDTVEHIGRKKLSTIANERHSSRILLRVLGPDTPMSDITPAVVADFRDKRITEGVGPSKICAEMALLSCLFGYAIKERGCILDNPCIAGKVTRPKPRQNRLVFLTVDEAERLVAECRKSRNKMLAPYVITLLQTALRPGEAIKLLVEDFDAVHKAINLIDTKTGQDRKIPLTAKAYATIAECVIGRYLDDHIFVHATEFSYHRTTKPTSFFRESFNAAKKRAGLPWITQHTLRHTAASHMGMAGVDIRTIADILGHATIQMTMKYIHVSPDHKRDAVNALSGLGEE